MTPEQFYQTPTDASDDQLSRIKNKLEGNKPRGVKQKAAELLSLLNQGTTVGTFDEISSAGKAATDWIFGDKEYRKNYDKYLAEERDRVDQARANQGLTGVAAEMIGAVPTALVGLPARGALLARHAIPNSLLSRVAVPAAEGAGFGAAYGFNTGEGGAVDRLKNAPIPAAAGMLGGVAVPVATSVGGKIGSAVQKHRTLKNTGIKNRDMIEPLYDILEVDTKHQTQSPAEMFKGDPSSGMAADMGPAARTVLKKSMESMDDNIVSASRDENVRKLTSISGLNKNQIEGAIAKRTQDASENIRNQLDDTLGETIGMQEARQRMTGTSTPKERLRNPSMEKDLQDMYETAYSARLPKPDDFAGVYGRIPDNVVKDAARKMKMEGIDDEHIQEMLRGFEYYRKGGKVDGSQEIHGGRRIVNSDDPAEAIIFRDPEVRFLDYIGRSLNDMAEKEKGSLGYGSQTNTQMGNLYGRLASDLREVMKEQLPEYRDVLAGAKASMGAKDALNLGFDSMNLGRKAQYRDFESAFNQLSDADRELVKQGMAEAIFDRMGGVKENFTPIPSQTGYVSRVAVGDEPGQELIKMLSSDDAKAKLKLVLGDEAYDTLDKSLKEAAAAFELEATSTHNIRKEMSDVFSQEDKVSDMALMGMGLGPEMVALQRVLTNTFGFRDKARSKRMYGDMANYLTQKPNIDDLNYLWANDAPRVKEIKGRAAAERNARRGTRVGTVGASNPEDRIGGQTRTRQNIRMRNNLMQMIEAARMGN